jgi:hypothetical protein
MGMLIVQTSLLGICEFPSNFLFKTIVHVSPSKPIPLECNGELETTLQTTFVNLFEFGE